MTRVLGSTGGFDSTGQVWTVFRQAWAEFGQVWPNFWIELPRVFGSTVHIVWAGVRQGLLNFGSIGQSLERLDQSLSKLFRQSLMNLGSTEQALPIFFVVRTALWISLASIWASLWAEFWTGLASIKVV